MKLCECCGWEYSENLLNELHIGHLGLTPVSVTDTNRVTTVPICGICALEISNVALGNNRARFDGPIAEHMRQLAIKWRRNNIQRCAPKEESVALKKLRSLKPDDDN